MKKIIIALFVSSLMFSSAQAIEYGVGVTGALAFVKADGKETETTNTGAEASVRTASVDAMTPTASIYAEVVFPYITLGYEIVPMSADVTDKVIRRTDASVAAAGEGVIGTNNRDADAEVENFQTFYAEVPLVGGFYVKAGISKIDLNTLETVPNNGGSYKNDTLDGVTYGAGVKGEIGGFTTKISGEVTNFDTYTALSGTTNKIQADLDMSQIKFSLGKQF